MAYSADLWYLIDLLTELNESARETVEPVSNQGKLETGIQTAILPRKATASLRLSMQHSNRIQKVNSYSGSHDNRRDENHRIVRR